MAPSTNTPSAITTFLHAWWLGIRPKTLPASIAGVITGIALAVHDNKFQFGPALAALVVGVLLQIASNLANDVFDFERGTDTDERLGPTRVTQAGMLAPGQVKIGLIVVIGLAVVLGIYLAFVAGWPVILIGLAAIASAILYTGGPFPLGYHGLGDLFVFLFFGLAAVAGTYFVQTGGVTGVVWWMAVPIGLLVVNLLVVNNLRDIPTDRKAGKFTLAILLGVRGSRMEYILFQGIAYGIVLVMILLSALPVWALLTWLSIPMAWRAARIVLKEDGRQLNPALGKTSQLALVYGLLLLVGTIISKIG
jgi:1,4-dihydroxy-2-naphthoate polyprenyltransferase